MDAGQHREQTFSSEHTVYFTETAWIQRRLYVKIADPTFRYRYNDDPENPLLSLTSISDEIFGNLSQTGATLTPKQRFWLTSCEEARIWLTVRDSSSEDSSESWRTMGLRLVELPDCWLSSSSWMRCSTRSRLSIERLLAPQLKLSTVSPWHR